MRQPWMVNWLLLTVTLARRALRATGWRAAGPRSAHFRNGHRDEAEQR